MECGSVHFYCKQRRFVPTTEQKKMYMSQGIPKHMSFVSSSVNMEWSFTKLTRDRQESPRTVVVGVSRTGALPLCWSVHGLRHGKLLVGAIKST